MTYNDFQSRVAIWIKKCFGSEAFSNKETRNFRFLEEALELVQSTGLTKEQAHVLVDYVYGRPVGEIEQEFGGVYLTFAAIGQAQGIDIQSAGEKELARVNQSDIIERIRLKDKLKPSDSPLPGNVE
jgi:hypothetical protein